MMKIFKEVAVFFLCWLLTVILLVASLSFTLNSFLYPSIYSQAFEKSGIYNYIDENIDNAQSATFIAIPPEGSKVLIDTLISNLLSYLRSDTDTLNISVKIEGEKLRNFFLDSVSRAERCHSLNQDPFDKKNPCVPEGMNSSEYLDKFFIRNNLSFGEEDTVDLAPVYNIGEGSDGRRNLEAIRIYIQYYMLSNILLIALIAVLIFLIYLLQDTPAFLRKVSICLAIPALVLFLIVYFISQIPNNLQVPDPLLVKLASAVIEVINDKLVIYASTMIIISLILFVTSFLINSSTSKVVTTK